MEQLKKHLENAYTHISKVTVSGDAVDAVALARMELREAYKELRIKEKEENIHAAEEDALRQREPESGAGTV